jgi:hypothetical protein
MNWVVLPGEGVELLVHIDNLDPVRVGYRSLREEMESSLEQDGHTGGNLRVEETTIGPVNIAYILEKIGEEEYWCLRKVKESSPFSCVQGIRINNETPGLEGMFFPVAVN